MKKFFPFLFNLLFHFNGIRYIILYTVYWQNFFLLYFYMHSSFSELKEIINKMRNILFDAYI